MIRFFAPGTPAPGGSKKAIPLRNGRAAIVDMGGQRNKDWRVVVALAGCEAMLGKNLLAVPLAVRFEFSVQRPKGHLDKHGKPRKSAPVWPAKRPDVLKLSRSTEDALTGIVWVDDSLIVDEMITKQYGTPGCWITVEEL